jgi:hypothetical protein
MAWDVVPNDPAIFREMRECGLTVAGFVTPQGLDACHAAGLKAIVHDPRCHGYNWTSVDASGARTNLASLVAEVGKHPAVFGYYLVDEPGVPQFGGLAKVAALVRELAPGKWPYINLFPNYANAEQLGASNYTSHLDQFVAACHPPIISYDHYALMNDGSLRGGYWLNLEQIRDVARRQRVPFWNIVLSTAHYSYREPTDADFRFQAYSTLAYGGQGLSYFTYFTPQWTEHPGPRDKAGQRTPVWYRLQAVNRQVLKLAPTLLALTSDAVYHFGDPPAGCHGPPENSLVAGINDTNFMVGDFTHRDGARYVMVVNKDLINTRHCAPRFRTPPRRVQYMSPRTGQLAPFNDEPTWLAPGQGVLLKLEE